MADHARGTWTIAEHGCVKSQCMLLPYDLCGCGVGAGCAAAAAVHLLLLHVRVGD